jgi:hypothetical protein
MVQTIGELQRSISATQQRIKKITARKVALDEKMKANSTELATVESEIRAGLPANSCEMPQVT